MRATFALALAASLFLTACGSRSACLDPNGLASNSELVRTYLIHSPELLAITGPDPVIDQERSHKYTYRPMCMYGGIRNLPREDHDFRLKGPDGAVYISYRLERWGGERWRLLLVRAVERSIRERITYPLVPPEDHKALERLLLTEVPKHPDIESFLAGRSIREFRISYPKYVDVMRYPDTDDGKLQVIDQLADLKTPCPRGTASRLPLISLLVLDDGTNCSVTGMAEWKDGRLRLTPSLSVQQNLAHGDSPEDADQEDWVSLPAPAGS